jgi:hypothetical protein
MRVAAPHLGEVGALPGREASGLAFRVVQQGAGLGIGQDLVAHHAEGRELLGTRRAAAVGHDRRHVPMQHAGGLLQRSEAAEALFQLGIRARQGADRFVHGLRSRSSFR